MLIRIGSQVISSTSSPKALTKQSGATNPDKRSTADPVSDTIIPGMVTLILSGCPSVNVATVIISSNTVGLSRPGTYSGVCSPAGAECVFVRALWELHNPTLSHSINSNILNAEVDHCDIKSACFQLKERAHLQFEKQTNKTAS